MARAAEQPVVEGVDRDWVMAWLPPQRIEMFSPRLQLPLKV